MGVFMAMLQLLMGIARAVASAWVGWAYDFLGPCGLWTSVFAFWAFQFVPFLGVRTPNTRPRPPKLNQLSPGMSHVCKPEPRRGGGGRRFGTSGTRRRCRGGMQRSMRRLRPTPMRRFTPSPSAAAVRCHVWVVIARGPVLS